jgi:TetR/AcrR family transcriptional repressor of nem operon
MGQHQSDVRQHILDIGKALILGKGFTAVGLAEVLTTAKVPKGSFYYYFDSKEQFGEALLETYFTSYLLDLEGLLKNDGSPARERLMRYWRRWADIQEQGPCREQCLVVKLSAEVSDLSETMRIALHRGTDGIIARLAACTAEGVADGSIPPLDPGSIAQALYELWLGASLLTKVRRNPSALVAAMATTESLLGMT